MRLIDADALSATMANYIEENRNASDLFLNGCADGAYHYQFAVDHAQTIEERKTGKWLVVKEGINTYRVKCSNCGIVLHTGHGFDSRESYVQIIRDACDKYCHNCGAKMEVDE